MKIFQNRAFTVRFNVCAFCFYLMFVSRNLSVKWQFLLCSIFIFSLSVLVTLTAPGSTKQILYSYFSNYVSSLSFNSFDCNSGLVLLCFSSTSKFLRNFFFSNIDFCLRTLYSVCEQEILAVVSHLQITLGNWCLYLTSKFPFEKLSSFSLTSTPHTHQSTHTPNPPSIYHFNPTSTYCPTYLPSVHLSTLRYIRTPLL